MVRANRVKEVFLTSADLVAENGNHLEVYTRPINGTIQKIEFQAGNYGANGSIILQISGLTNESIWEKNGTANVDSVVYPHVYTVDSSNTTGSPLIAKQRLANAPLRFLASGVGANKSGLGLSIQYI